MKNDKLARQVGFIMEVKQTEIKYFGVFRLLGLAALFTLNIICIPNGDWSIHYKEWKWFCSYTNIFCCSYMLVLQVELATHYLDKKYNWFENFMKRIFWQLILGGIVPLCIPSLWYYVVFYKMNIDLPRITEYRSVFSSVLLLNIVYLLHYGYSLLHFRALGYDLDEPEENITGTTVVHEAQSNHAEQKAYTGKTVGGDSITVNYNDIVLFSIKENLRFLKMTNGDVIFLEDNLKKIDMDLEYDYFFLITRDYIVPRETIKDIKKNNKRGLEIELINGVKVDQSRKKYKAFQTWYGKPIPKISRQFKKTPKALLSSLLGFLNISL